MHLVHWKTFMIEFFGKTANSIEGVVVSLYLITDITIYI